MKLVYGVATLKFLQPFLLTRRRPSKSIEECCETTKHRKVKSLVDSNKLAEISKPTEIKLFEERKRDFAKIIK